MSCSFSREVLALYVGGDLADSSVRTAQAHLRDCRECRGFCERLDNTQAVFRSLRRTSATADAGSIRHAVLSRIESSRDALGWALRIERFVFLQLFRRSYAYAAAAILVIVSMTVLAQIRPGEPRHVAAAAMFDSDDRLTRPMNYRDWTFVGAPQQAAIRSVHVSPGVYIEPSAYRTFQSTGSFPEGTVVVLESTDAQRNIVELQVSVKDSSRFAGGWGYFGFVEADGNLRTRAVAFAESAGCRGCHEARAETDHVFTQFYPMLRVRRS